MPTQENSQPEELPEVVTQAATRITDAKKTGKLIAILIAALASAVAIFTLYVKLRKQGKELAKLKHEKNVHVEEAKQAEADAEIAKNDESFNEAIDQARQAEEAVVDLELKITETNASLAAKREAIQALSTWDDVTKFLEKK